MLRLEFRVDLHLGLRLGDDLRELLPHHVLRALVAEELRRDLGRVVAGDRLRLAFANLRDHRGGAVGQHEDVADLEIVDLLRGRRRQRQRIDHGGAATIGELVLVEQRDDLGQRLQRPHLLDHFLRHLGDDDLVDGDKLALREGQRIVAHERRGLVRRYLGQRGADILLEKLDQPEIARFLQGDGGGGRLVQPALDRGVGQDAAVDDRLQRGRLCAVARLRVRRERPQFVAHLRRGDLLAVDGRGDLAGRRGAPASPLVASREDDAGRQHRNGAAFVSHVSLNPPKGHLGRSL